MREACRRTKHADYLSLGPCVWMWQCQTDNSLNFTDFTKLPDDDVSRAQSGQWLLAILIWWKTKKLFFVCGCIHLLVCVFSGGRCCLQQSGGGAGGDYVLVGRMGQVDGLHSHLWRRSHDAGATLPQAEVSPSKQTREENQTKYGFSPKRVFSITFAFFF